MIDEKTINTNSGRGHVCETCVDIMSGGIKDENKIIER